MCVTYSAGNFADLISLALLVSNVLNHVVGEKAHCEVVVTADDASEHRHAGHSEENILHDLGSVHFVLLLCLVQINFQIIKQINQ